MRRATWIVAILGALLLVAPAMAAPSLVGNFGDFNFSLDASDLAGLVIRGIQDAKPIDIDVEIGREDGDDVAWVVSPVWLAIGGLAVLVVLILIVMAVRGPGGTTVVHE